MHWSEYQWGIGPHGLPNFAIRGLPSCFPILPNPQSLSKELCKRLWDERHNLRIDPIVEDYDFADFFVPQSLLPNATTQAQSGSSAAQLSLQRSRFSDQETRALKEIHARLSAGGRCQARQFLNAVRQDAPGIAERYVETKLINWCNNYNNRK